jgi:hypothetical protein
MKMRFTRIPYSVQNVCSFLSMSTCCKKVSVCIPINQLKFEITVYGYAH